MEPTTAPAPPPAPAPPARPRPRAGRKRMGWVIGLATVAVGAGSLFLWKKDHAGSGHRVAGVDTDSPSRAEKIRVEVVRPRVGGIVRSTVQPGSVYAFEQVELQAMVSGYLKTQHVDIGSRVTKGQVLAEIDAPRERSAADEAEANVGLAKAQADQAEARVKAAEAERETASAARDQAISDVDRLVANRRLAESQLARVQSLSERNAIERRLVDEQQRNLDAAIADEKTSGLAVQTAKAKLAAAAAKVEQARADVAEARASISVAEARAAKARIDLGYAQIVAPFDGVITHRGFFIGSFIRAATGGAQPPLLTVTRTDLMRVVVRVPDRDVVLANPGDPAVITIDGLDGQSFKAPVSRIAESEEHETRTMRVEIDLPNPDGQIREGMYGKVHIGLEQTSDRLTVPVACISDRSGKGMGTVQVVRDGKVEKVKVELGADNGSLVEVDEGLSASDEIVVRSATPLEPGMSVATVPAATAG